MSLANRCSYLFSADTRRQGQGYYSGGFVDLVFTSSGAAATVGGKGEAYDVLLGLGPRPNTLFADCNCPHYADGFLCKHLWAALLAVEGDGYGYGDPIPGSGPLAIVGSDDLVENEGKGNYFFAGDQDEGDAGLLGFVGQLLGDSSSVTSPSSGSKTLTQQAKKRPSVPRWLRQLNALQNDESSTGQADAWESFTAKQRQVWYVLDVGNSAEQGRPWIDLYQRTPKRNGDFGKIKRLSVRPERIREFSDPQDRELLELLLANQSDDDPYDDGYDDYYSYRYRYNRYRPGLSGFDIPQPLIEIALPRLCATGRLTWILGDPETPDVENRLCWDDGPAWRFRLRIDSDQKRRQWNVTGELYRGEETAELKSPMLLCPGLAVFPRRVALLDDADSDRWIELLRREERLEIPFKDADKFSEYLWGLPQIPRVELPKELQWEQIRQPPQGKLTVLPPEDSGRRTLLVAKVEMIYGGHVISPEVGPAAVTDKQNKRVLVRDSQRERELLQRLSPLGVRAAERHYGGKANLQFPAKALPDVVDQLVAEGWIVEAQGRRVRRAGEFNLSVTSGVDWFELEGEFDFDGISASLPELLAALRKGEKYVRLGDGSQGMLPEEWLKQYGLLADLGEAEGDAVRFKPSQGALLDALLAAQPNVDLDAGFRQFREKLRSFDGIDPADPSQQFTGQLREYQREGLGWLNFLRDFRFGGCLADDMGLGKTVQVLALLESRRTRSPTNRQPRHPSLVVVPRSLVYNWIEEAGRFTPKLKMLDYTGLERAEKFEQLSDYDVVVTTYGTLRRDILKLKDQRFDYAILDESQAIKNSQSQAAKACRLLDADHRLAMTGTPVENHLGELWSLFEFLNPGMLGRSKAFSAVAKNGRNGNGHASIELLAQSLRPFMLRRTKEQVLTELPEKNEQTVYCEMEKKQRAYYDELRDYYRAQLTKRVKEAGMAKSKIQVLEALLRLRQAACHPGLIDKDKTAEPSAKLEALLEQVKEVVDEGHKVLVFSQFTSLLSIVRERMDGEKITYEYLDGRTRKRGDKVRRFQEDPGCPLFLISLKAGGHGLNLTAADYVFILDPWWNPAVEAQAVDRAHRIGQTRRVFAYRLICRDTVEEKILELQKKKRGLADAIVSADNSLIRSLTAEDLQLLLS